MIESCICGAAYFRPDLGGEGRKTVGSMYCMGDKYIFNKKQTKQLTNKQKGNSPFFSFCEANENYFSYFKAITVYKSL